MVLMLLQQKVCNYKQGIDDNFFIAGIPSVPIIRNIQSNRNSSAARLSVITEYVGVPSDDDSFKFIVYYVAQESSTNEQMSEFPFPHYNESAVVDLTINNLSAGRYTFSVVARNKYGNSHRSDPEELTVTTGWYPLFLYFINTIFSDPPPTTTSRPTSTMQPTRSPAPIGAIVGGVIGGLVFLVAVAVTAAIAIVCYIKKFTGEQPIYNRFIIAFLQVEQQLRKSIPYNNILVHNKYIRIGIHTYIHTHIYIKFIYYS